MALNFDYIYYRLAKFFLKGDGKDAIRAVLGVSMIQLLIVGDLVLIPTRIMWDRHETAPYSKVIGGISVVLLLIIIIFNYIKYKSKYDEFDDRWKDETRLSRVVKGFLVLICLILPWVPIFILGTFM